ncbi:MAG TPA: hypothetical protein VGL53_06525 [Bryobacteraceae bacterium]
MNPVGAQSGPAPDGSGAGPDEQEIRASVERLLGSSAFRIPGRRARLLNYLVDRTLAGDASRINEYAIGVDVFEKPASFDPKSDAVVRAEISRLRQNLKDYYEGPGREDPMRIDLPARGYFPVFRPNVPAAPAQVETPPEAPLAPPVSSPSVFRRSRWLVAAVGVCLVAAGGIAVYSRLRTKQPPTIVVLPFANLSAHPGNQYFSDGLTDEITDQLSRLKSLRVLARSSASQFKGKTVDIREVGRALNVANVLEGSVERSGDRVKIIAHLERAADGTLLWSNTYERPASDLFAVQSELAAGIAASLKVAAGSPSTKHVPSSEAHEYYLKGRYSLQQGTTASVAEAEDDFSRALEADPNYAEAYVGLASAKYNRIVARVIPAATVAERESTEKLWRKALELDPDLPAAHAALALGDMTYHWDWAGAERELQLALAGPPNASVESTYAFLLIFRGRFTEADEHLRRMQDIEPFSTGMRLNLALARGLEGRFAEAREINENVAALYPKILGAHIGIAFALVMEGHPDQALVKVQELKQKGVPGASIYEAMALAKTGHREQALELIRPYEDKYPEAGIPVQWLALVYASMGDQANTLKWLERSAERHEWQALNLGVHPAYAFMRNSPGFRALEKRMGLDRN